MTVEGQQVLEALQDAGHVGTASEVADELDVSRRTASRKLTQLHDDGLVSRKDIGGRAVAWWTDDGDDTGDSPEDLADLYGPETLAKALMKAEPHFKHSDVEDVIVGSMADDRGAIYNRSKGYVRSGGFHP